MCFLNIKACQHILLHQIHKITIFKKASYDLFNFSFFILVVIVSSKHALYMAGYEE